MCLPVFVCLFVVSLFLHSLYSNFWTEVQCFCHLRVWVSMCVCVCVKYEYILGCRERVFASLLVYSQMRRVLYENIIYFLSNRQILFVNVCMHV